MKQAPQIGIGFCLVMTAWVVASVACCTSPVRNAAVEQSIEAFVQRAEPGSSIALFNGRDLTGWRAHGLGRWRVNNGVLSVTGGFGYLASACDTFTDFILSLDVRASDGANSGVFFRAKHPGFGLRPWPVGYEAQIDNNDSENPTGSLYKIQTANSIFTQDGEWLSMEVRCINNRFTILINDEIVVEQNDETFKRGFIAFQGHHPNCKVEYKNIELKIP